MSIKYTERNRFLPDRPEKQESMFALLTPGIGRLGGSGFFSEQGGRKLIVDLRGTELDELFDLIEELENKDEKDN